MGAYWLVVGFMTSAVTLHIATLLLLDDPSFAKAVAVSAAVWLLGVLFTVVHVGGILFGISSLVLGCVVLKRLYGVSTGEALVVFFLHAIVEIAIGVMLWFTFPALLGREPRATHQRARAPHAARAGSGCPVSAARV